MRKSAQVNELKKKSVCMFDAWIDNRFKMAKCISEHFEMNDFMNQANSNPTQTAAEATSKSAQCSLKSIFLCVRAIS